MSPQFDSDVGSGGDIEETVSQVAWHLESRVDNVIHGRVGGEAGAGDTQDDEEPTVHPLIERHTPEILFHFFSYVFYGHIFRFWLYNQISPLAIAKIYRCLQFLNWWLRSTNFM